MNNQKDALSPIYGKVPTTDEARAAIKTALDDSEKALRVLSTMLKKENLKQGYVVADEILGSVGYAKKLNAALSGNGRWCIEKVEESTGFEQWIDNDWPLWRNCPDSHVVQRLRRAWTAGFNTGASQ